MGEGARLREAPVRDAVTAQAGENDAFGEMGEGLAARFGGVGVGVVGSGSGSAGQRARWACRCRGHGVREKVHEGRPLAGLEVCFGHG